MISFSVMQIWIDFLANSSYFFTEISPSSIAVRLSCQFLYSSPQVNICCISYKPNTREYQVWVIPSRMQCSLVEWCFDTLWWCSSTLSAAERQGSFFFYYNVWLIFCLNIEGRVWLVESSFSDPLKTTCLLCIFR